MEKKLLSVYILGFFFLLNPWSGFGQCPTSVNISADPGTTVCEDAPITFKVTSNGGTGVKYQWKVGTTDVGGNNPEYTHSDPVQGQQISVIITSESDENCSITRNFNSLTVNPLRTPTVAIANNKTSLCSGENITFNATNTHGGSGASYEWFINNSNTVAKTGSSVTFSSSDFDAGTNNVRVVLTSSVNCVTSTTAEAKSADFELKPDATISDPSNKDQEVCINTGLDPISFSIGGGGTGATVSGLPPGVSGSFNSGTLTISGNPTSAGEFNYTVTTTGTCAQTTATGTIIVNPNATIALASGNNNQTICAAGGVADANIEPITYAIGETGTGAKVTGLPSGISGSFNNGTFTIEGSSSVTGTHNFSVTAEGSCGDSSSLTGSITITENLAPSVSITSSESDNEICAGSEITFTATPTNGGPSPYFQWQVDGNNAGTNSSTFTTSSLTDGQTVTVIMTSHETCIAENTATSNGIITKVNPNLTPEVTIEASDTNFCAGDEVTYKAIPVNGGSSPSYQWKVGSNVVGSGESFTSTSLTNGQSITVTLTSSETCVTSSTAVSEPVITSVNENLVPSVTIESNDENNIICSGGNITFTATPTNGGESPSYQWKVDGANTGSNSSTFTTSSLTDGQKVSVVLTSNEECLAENDVESNEIEIQVDNDLAASTPVWDYTTPSNNPDAVCPVVSDLVYKVEPLAGASSYDWTFPNSGWTIVTGAGSNEITVRAGTTASAGNITVTAKNECGSSNTQILPVTTGTVVYVEAGPDLEICPGTTDIALEGEIGGVITKNQDWDWYASVNGGPFTQTGFSNGGNSLTGSYTIPTTVRNGGTVTIRIESIDPAGPCDAKIDDRIITIQTAASLTDPSNKNQTVCINSEIDDISYTVGGAGKGATTTGLPAGVTGTFEDGVYTLSGTPTEAGTFNYTVTTTGDCTNTNRSGTITVNPRPTFNQPEAVAVCAGSNTENISFTGSSVSGTTYEWENDNTSIGLAASGNGDISGFTASNNTNSPITANITVTPTANNCEGSPQEFQITVYPTATFTEPADIEVCNTETIPKVEFSGSTVEGTTYNWINDNPAIGLGETGTGNINSFTAENNSNETITANITVTPIANGCEGTAETFSITVNPTSTFTQPEDIVICNDEPTSEVDFNGGSVSGTTYTWTNDNPEIGLAASGSGNLPSFTANNPGNEPIIANITVIPEANECEGTTHSFQITVNPTPIVTVPSTIILCNGEDFNGTEFEGNVAGISYSWSNNQPTIGLGQSGEGNIPSFTAVNESDEPVTAVITITPTANECEGEPVDLDIIINPNATVNAGPDITICSSGTASMEAILGGGATEGSWTTSGSGTFNNNETNAEYTPSGVDIQNGSVILTYTTNDPDGPCGAVEDSLELIINEEVVITTHPENIGVCSTEPSQLTVIASGDNLTYEWKRTDGASITNASGINSSTLSFNNTTSTQGGEYYVVVTGEDSCEEAISDTVSINVDENIIIEEPTFPVPYCGDGFSEITMKFIAHANGTPLEFIWYRGNDLVDTSDPNIVVETQPVDDDGKYEGTLTISNLTTAYNDDYYVEIKGPDEFTCSTAVTNPFQLRLDEMPALPEVADIVYCQGDEAEPLTVISGEDLTWYATETGDDAFADTPTPDTSNFGETSYWVTQTPDVCESERVEVKVIIKEKPVMPEVENVQYCLGATSQELTAIVATDATLNWYDSEGEALTTAPTPDTENAGDILYYVSQTPNDGFGCESELAEITVTIFSLPEVVATIEEDTVCLGTAAELTGSGAETYIWYDGENEIGTGSQFSYTPEAPGDYTITLLGTDTNGCENTAEITFKIDEPTQEGTLTGPESVCVTNPAGELTLADHLGEIQHWEKSTDGGASWTEIAETTETLSFSELTEPTSFRAVVKNGVCEELNSNSVDITIDPLPVGGELAFGEFGRMFITCENPDASTLVDLNLSGVTGQIDLWEYKPASQNDWITITEGSENYTETSLTGAKIASLNLQETTAFRVKIISGACEAFAFSQTGILSIISSDIEPTPVTVDKEVICFDESVTLSAGTGYESGEEIGDGGDFDNASITNHGWRVQKDGKDEGFSTSASNTRPDIWRRVTPREFITANINNNNTSLQLFDPGIDDGNKGFAIVSGSNASTLETPVFSITEMDQAILQFDQAYNLTAGATVSVEISTNGGASYESVLFSVTGPSSSGNYSSFGTGTPESRPLNKMAIDLGNYLGMGNLRIRFNYAGIRDGDVWTLDGIKIPDGPANIGTVWKDYTQDPENPTVIGTNHTETWTPTQIGWNSSVIITTLEYSNGSCETAVNSEEIRVFVFDTYNTSITATTGSCGVTSAQLAATVTGAKQGEITSYPTKDSYIGQWEVSGPEGYTFSNPEGESGEPINNPNAIFTADDLASYTLTWVLIPTEEDEDGNLIEPPCTPENESYDLNFEPCLALDFDGEDDYVDLGENYTGNGYSFEAWVKPTNVQGTIISGPQFNISTPSGLSTSRWTHVAVAGGKLYLDGVESGSAPAGNGGDRTLIGARWDDVEATDHFHGWIEEVRIWNKVLDTTQIRFMMNQRLKDNGTQMGEQIPMDVPGGLTYGDLEGYYRLISAEPDPDNLVTFDPALMPIDGKTPDLALGSIPGVLKNMETNQQNTAPLPYFSGADGNWDTAGTWARGTLWALPNSNSVDWNIVRTLHNVDAARDVTVLGLLSEENILNIQGTNPTGWVGGGTGNALYITHYLLLNGVIDLNGESQLLQPPLSIIEPASSGVLHRDQQGTANSYNYNYWSSPVSENGSNADYTVAGVLRDGTNPANPVNISFGPAHWHADAGKTTPIKISDYWISIFNGAADEYGAWAFQYGSAAPIRAGEGFTMKGTSGDVPLSTAQNYTFEGLPHNGDVFLPSTVDRNYLIGNPYPSAIDAEKFINDNLAVKRGAGNNYFDGALYFWDHFGQENSHILLEYVGGYASLTKIGAVPAISNDDRINNNDQKNTKIPGPYIPVGQSFFINSTTGDGYNIKSGDIHFKNSQRVFVTENNSGESQFLKPEIHTKNSRKEDIEKIRISYSSPLGYYRQILVGAHPDATENYDLGYDARIFDYNEEDMYWLQGNNWLVIQGVPDFNEDRILPLGIVVKEEGEFTIQIDSLENFAELKNVYINDKLNDSVHNLTKRAYTTTSEGGYIHDRFEIIFYYEEELPVDPGGKDEDIVDAIELNVKHGHDVREIQILNPDQIPLNDLHLFDVNGNLITTYRNISHEKEVRLPVKSYSSGVYIIKLYGENTVISKKIIISN